MSVMGMNIEQMDVPVCNSFQPKIIRDQLCYTVDPNKYKNDIKIERDKLDLTLFLNYNEDRLVSSFSDNLNHSTEDFSILIETIGKVYP